jgi:D-xylose transport system permease protein
MNDESTAGGQQAPAEGVPDEASSTPAEQTSRFDDTTTEGIFSGGPLAILARLGSLRVFIVLAVIWIIFQTQNDNFLSSFNLTNLVLQIAGVGMISIGVTMILLLGEIDLGVGAVSGLAAAVMAVLNVKHGWSPALALLAGVAVGLVIGVFNGVMVTRFGIPSFVVTLAGLLGWQGALLYVLGDTGSVNLPPSVITDLTTTFFDPETGWTIGIIAIALYAAMLIFARRRRAAAGLEVGKITGTVVRLVAVSAAIIGSVIILNEDRGVPLALVIVLALSVIFAFLTDRTRWGRHVFAVGGNEEAARRAGINTNAVRVSVFTLASMLAAFGGILAASRGLAVNQQSGTGDVLLLAIAGPVIAGTSLFGGRGSIWSAILGAIVIGSISNGMDLLALDSDVKFMITGAVLLGAVTIDAATQRRRAAAR